MSDLKITDFFWLARVPLPMTLHRECDYNQNCSICVCYVTRWWEFFVLKKPFVTKVRLYKLCKNYANLNA